MFDANWFASFWECILGPISCAHVGGENTTLNMDPTCPTAYPTTTYAAYTWHGPSAGPRWAQYVSPGKQKWNMSCDRPLFHTIPAYTICRPIPSSISLKAWTCNWLQSSLQSWGLCHLAPVANMTPHILIHFGCLSTFLSVYLLSVHLPISPPIYLYTHLDVFLLSIYASYFSTHPLPVNLPSLLPQSAYLVHKGLLPKQQSSWSKQWLFP